MQSPAQSDLRPTLIYCRESRDENSENYERIEVQKEMLLRFCKRQGLYNIVDIVLDDDISGTSFARLKPIVERVKRGEIQVLVFKDGSRLGRNLKESLIFTETIESYGAEILFESEEYNEDFFPLRQWFNEQRAKEDSLKIRRVLRHKMETGELLVRPFYGYRRGEDGKMVPEEEAAQVVRWIFEKASKGWGNSRIAFELNARGLPTPSQVQGKQNAAPAWGTQHIRRILENPVYTGTMIHSRTTRKSYKDKKTVNRPQEDWIVLERHHEALVPQELFDAVQRDGKKDVRMSAVRKSRPFSGLLRCGRCGRSLVLRTRCGRAAAYVCGKNHAEGAVKDAIRLGYGCLAHHVKEAVLFGVVRDYLAALLSAACVDWERIKKEVLETRQQEQKRAKLQKKLEQTERTIEKIYDDRLAGVIPEALFLKKTQEYAARRAEIEKELAALDSLRQEGALADLTPQALLDELQTAELSKELLHILFAGAVVYEKNEICEEESKKWGLSPESFQLVQKNGGIIFLERGSLE